MTTSLYNDNRVCFHYKQNKLYVKADLNAKLYISKERVICHIAILAKFHGVSFQVDPRCYGPCIPQNNRLIRRGIIFDVLRTI